MARNVIGSRGTILNRLIHPPETGIDPGRIRSLSSQFEGIEDQRSDARASISTAKISLHDAPATRR